MTAGLLRHYERAARALVAGAAIVLFGSGAFAADPIKIGQVAALSGASAQSGEAITRGLTLAIEEINAKGGLLGGRMLELVQRDDESSPPKGLIAARELAAENVAAIFGGIDTPVSLAIVPVLNKEKRIYMGVWAAGTGITRNGADPNYAFRVSAVDALVDVKLLKFAHQKFGAKKAGLMLINNPWGQGNEKGLQAAAKADPSVEIVGVEKFENNDVDMVPQLTRLKDAGADSIILVVNAPPGAQVMKSRERMGWTVPVISHWGISGGRFPELAGPTAGEADFVQTYSFFGKQNPVGQRVLAALPAHSRFEPLLTLYLTDSTSAVEIDRARDTGFIHGVKLYPAGATTHSDSGVTDIKKLYGVLERMQEIGMRLLVHGESPQADVDVFDRETHFIDTVLAPLLERFTKLSVVLEHITTERAVQFVAGARAGVAATRTAKVKLFSMKASYCRSSCRNPQPGRSCPGWC